MQVGIRPRFDPLGSKLRDNLAIGPPFFVLALFFVPDRASREKLGTGFSQQRGDTKQIEQDGASELAHLALVMHKEREPI
jgi:hypothetical protein